MKILAIIIAVVTSVLFVSCKNEKVSSNIQSITVSEIGKLKIDHKDLVILDVRTPKEISAGKISSDALELNFYSDGFENKINRMDKSKTYLVYCKSGGRSSQAIQLMSKNGFNDLFNLEGGYTAWSKNN